MRPLAVGHRGDPANAPENTLAGYESAIRAGVDVIEVDVRATRDDKIALVHNDTLDETTNGSGRVDALTFDELRRLDAGAHRGEAFKGAKIPSLAEALDLMKGRAVVNLDLKATAAIEPMIADVRDARMRGGVVVTGCAASWVPLVRDVDPGLAVFLNSDDELNELAQASSPEFTQTAIERALSVGAQALNFNHRFVTPEFVEAARRRGLPVWTWTVDDEERMRELARMGVAAITSNDPTNLVKTLSAMEQTA